MPLTLRAAGVAAVLLIASAAPAAAQVAPPPALAGTQLTTFAADEPPGAAVVAARCTTSFGFAAFSAEGTVTNGGYSGDPFREGAAAQLGAGEVSEAFEPRALRAAAHGFEIDSPLGRVVGTQHAAHQMSAAICAKPDPASLYLSYFPDTRYAARIETPLDGVWVDRGDGSLSVDIFESAEGERSANTLTSFERSDTEVTRPLRRRDCRHGGFAELAYPSAERCREAAYANRRPTEEKGEMR